MIKEFFVGVAKAAATPDKEMITIPSIGFVKTDLQHVINVVITTLLFIAGTTAVIYFIYSGILYLTAAGNPDAAKKGQQGLMYGAIGIIIIVLARYIVTGIASFANT